MIANARMYSATPASKAAWKALLGEALARARLDWPVVDHDPPAPLAQLWAREDLGCAMMCGLPYSQRAPRPTLVAAPLPSPSRYGGRPVYFTDLAVRADAPFEKLEDTFGAVVGFTLPDSMSGYVAFRAHLHAYGRNLYKKAVGGLLNARKVIEALDARRIDVGPLDSYYYDLLCAGEPALAAKVKIVASTRALPIPPLVATGALAPDSLARLRGALLATGPRKELLLAGFAIPAPAEYDEMDGVLELARRYPDRWQ